ncbi:MAG: DUF3857 domain-containing protein [Bacteroidetes bacterium]|nr:DUF3857 domain-containing protein [Bacteroidota bacterium]
MLKHLLLTLSLFLPFALLAQNSDLDKGWASYAENDFEKANAHFKKAIQSDDKAEAHLGLYLSALSDGAGLEASLPHFASFYRLSETPDPYVEALGPMGYGKRTEEQLELLDEIYPKTNPKVKALINQTRGYHYREIGDFKKAERYFAAVGSISDWKLLGEFENISESGFSKDFGVVDKPQANATFINKTGVEVTWFDLKQPREDNWVDFEYSFYTDNSILYAQSFVNSPATRDVQFRVGTSGSLKVWINDQLLFSESEEGNNDLDTYIFTGQLKAGYNRILVQIGRSEINNCNFLMRITDHQGKFYPDLTYTSEVQSYEKGNYGSKTLPNESEAYFERQVKQNPDKIHNYIILAKLYLKNDKSFRAGKLLEEAKERFPNNSYIIVQLIESNLRDQQRTKYSSYLEELKDKDPEGLLSLNLLYREALDIEDLDEAGIILKKIEEKQGLSANVYTKRIELAGERSESEKLIALVEDAYEAYPDDYSFVYLMYLVEKDVNGNGNKASRVLQKYLKENYSTEAKEALAGYYFGINEVSAGINIYEELVENHPIAVGYYRTLSDIYFTLRRYNKAEEYIKECIALAPYVGAYYKTLAQIHSEQKEKLKAKLEYERAIELDPYDYEARKLLRTVEGEPDVFTNFKETDVYALCRNAPDASAYPEDNSVLLLDEVQSVVYEDGGSEMRRVMVVKVFNTDGVDIWKEYSIPVYGNQNGNIEKSEVVKANGTKVESQNQGANLVFQALEPGDAIHISYKLQNYYSGKLTDQFWDKFYFNFFFPVQQTRYSLIMPKSKEFQYKTENFDMDPDVEDLGDQKLYVWEMDDLPSIKGEPFMSSLSDVGMVLHISTISDWSFVADWYSDLAKAKAKVDYRVEEAVDDLFEGKEGLSDMEKVQMIYEFVVSNIRYSSVSFIQSGLVPQKASHVLSTKQGDCKDVSTLFVAMCKSQGIDANLVLVNSKDNGLKDMMLPNINFNHCIAKVTVANKDYFLELTDDNLPFAANYNSVYNAFILEIPEEQGTPVEGTYLTSGNRLGNHSIRSSEVYFEGESMRVERHNRKTGTLASSMRSTYENLGEERRFKEMQESIAYDHPLAELDEVTFPEGLDSINESVIYDYSFHMPSAFTKISGLSIFKVPLTDAINSLAFLTPEDRDYPIELWNYFSGEYYEETLIIHLPEGKTIKLPEEENLRSEYMEYDLSFEGKGEEVIITRKLRILQDLVQPEDYRSFAEQCNAIIQADNLQLALE